MEKVYQLSSGKYEDYQIHGTFPSFEDAERAKFLWGIEANYSYVDIEEVEVETIPPLPELDGRLPFEVSLHHHQEKHPVYVKQGWYGRSSKEKESYSFSPNSEAEHLWGSNSPIEEGYIFAQESQTYTFYVWAKDKKEAEKIATEKYAKVKRI